MWIKIPFVLGCKGFLSVDSLNNHYHHHRCPSVCSMCINTSIFWYVLFSRTLSQVSAIMNWLHTRKSKVFVVYLKHILPSLPLLYGRPIVFTIMPKNKKINGSDLEVRVFLPLQYFFIVIFILHVCRCFTSNSESSHS